jgi:prophage regulatory protein
LPPKSKATNRKIIRKPAVRELVGLSDSQIWRLERAGLFPRRVQLGPLAVGWFGDEVVAWVEARERVGGRQPPLPKNRRGASKK